MSAGSAASVLSEENPVPKSSIAMRTPKLFSRLRAATPPSALVARADFGDLEDHLVGLRSRVGQDALQGGQVPVAG